MVNSVRDLEEDDIVEIDETALSGSQWRVSDVQVEDIGITETLAVSLVSASQDTLNYSIVGTTGDSVVTLSAIDSDDEHRVFWQQMEVVGSA